MGQPVLSERRCSATQFHRRPHVALQTLRRMQRLFALVVVAAHFLLHVMEAWPPLAVTWLRLLGGKLGLQVDRDEPSILLRGLQAVWQTVATLTLLVLEPFPHHAFESP